MSRLFSQTQARQHTQPGDAGSGPGPACLHSLLIGGLPGPVVYITCFVTYDFDQRQTYPGRSLLAVSNKVALGIILTLIDPILYVERFLSRASVVYKGVIF